MAFVGIAGWSAPRDQSVHFPEGGSVLARYASIFNCAEINSTFTRIHRAATLERWAASVPEGFRFAVKLPKAVTHERRLQDCDEEVGAFLKTIAPLGQTLGPLLVQLPPSLAFEPDVVATFLESLRRRTDLPVVCEPRHISWFTGAADELLGAYHVARVAADPAIVPEASLPGADGGTIYLRLHGSPKVYYSAYGADRLRVIAEDIRGRAGSLWCIFDNTASGAAVGDAYLFQGLLSAA
jgi:uncharacterized protein YecE (DUF72 family)